MANTQDAVVLDPVAALGGKSLGALCHSMPSPPSSSPAGSSLRRQLCAMRSMRREAFNECDQCGQCVAGRPAATRAAPRPPWAAHRGGQRQPHSGRPQFKGGPAAQRGRPAARSGRPISGGGRPLFRVRGRPTLFGQRAARFGGWARLVAAQGGPLARYA